MSQEIVFTVLGSRPSIKECATSCEKVFSRLVPIVFWGFMVLGLVLPALAGR